MKKKETKCIADEESTKEAILYLEKFGIYAAGQDISEATSRVISSLRAVGELAAALTFKTSSLELSKIQPQLFFAFLGIGDNYRNI